MFYAVLASGRVLEYPEGPTYPAWEHDGTDGRPSDVAWAAQEMRSSASLEERTRPARFQFAPSPFTYTPHEQSCGGCELCWDAYAQCSVCDRDMSEEEAEEDAAGNPMCAQCLVVALARAAK